MGYGMGDRPRTLPGVQSSPIPPDAGARRGPTGRAGCASLFQGKVISARASPAFSISIRRLQSAGGARRTPYLLVPGRTSIDASGAASGELTPRSPHSPDYEMAAVIAIRFGEGGGPLRPFVDAVRHLRDLLPQHRSGSSNPVAPAAPGRFDDRSGAANPGSESSPASSGDHRLPTSPRLLRRPSACSRGWASRARAADAFRRVDRAVRCASDQC